MKRIHDDDIKALQDILVPLDEHCPLPHALKGEVVMQNAESPRRNWSSQNFQT